MTSRDLILAATAKRPLTTLEISTDTGIPLGTIKNVIGSLQREEKLVNVSGKPARYSSSPSDIRAAAMSRGQQGWDFTALLQAWAQMTESARGNG